MAFRESSSSRGRTGARAAALCIAALGASLGPAATLVAAQDTAPSTPADAQQPATASEPIQPPPSEPADGSDATGSTPPEPITPPPAGQVASSGASTSPPTIVSSSSQTTAASSGGVSARDNFFTPPSITIQTGETLTWTNEGQSAHTVTAAGGSFDSGNLNPGQGFSHTFTQSGTFAYYCQYHRSLGMKGTVTVTSPASSSGSGPGFGAGGSNANSGAAGAGTGGGGGGTTTGSGSESFAGGSPGAAGSSTQLPSTGLPILPPLLVAGLLIASGLLLRRRASLGRRGS